MARVLVTEGTSGIVELAAPGLRETFVPDNDLDRALELLFRLYELRSTDGGRFLDNYWQDGFNWLSGQVGNLYWRYLFRYVQYAPLLERFQSGELGPVFRNKVNLARIHEVLHPRGPSGLGGLRSWWRYRRVLPAHNRTMAASGDPSLYFYRYGPNDFRTRDMAAIFAKRNVPLRFVYSASARMLKNRASQPRPVYFLHRRFDSTRLFRRGYDYSGLNPDMARLFRAVVERVEANMSFQRWEYERHLEALRPNPPKLVFGLDDHQEIHPLLFACKTLGVPTLGYQLGMYARRQAAYVMEGWEPGAYQWYDKVITWGPYWEDVVRRWGRVFPEGYFLPGTNKNPYGYNRLESDKFDVRHVLVPYEFWGNTRRIGQYMQRLMDLGCTVSFKFKPDERPKRQLDCYMLPESYRERVRPLYEITDEVMARVNVVAGGMTTLLYDLLPYGKHTWVLDTEFRLLDDMVEDGWAEKVGMDDLEERVANLTRADRDIDAARLFNPDALEDVLERHVLSRL